MYRSDVVRAFESLLKVRKQKQRGDEKQTKGFAFHT